MLRILAIDIVNLKKNCRGVLPLNKRALIIPKFQGNIDKEVQVKHFYV